jgi:hypothetical protein
VGILVNSQELKRFNLPNRKAHKSGLKNGASTRKMATIADITENQNYQK